MSESIELPPESLTSLVDASAVINNSNTLDETLGAIARAATSVLRAEAASVVMLDTTRNRQVFRAAVGDRADQIIGVEYEKDEGVSGKVLVTGRAIVINDIGMEKSHYKGIDHLVGFETRSMIAAPLVHEDQPLGVIEIINPVDNKQFDEQDRQLAQLFANLSAIAVANSKKYERLEMDNRGLKRSIGTTGEMIGDSKPMKEIARLIEQVAATQTTVLLLGQTGTGKEVAARGIHEKSDRSDRPFVAVNCAALPPSLMESELFGHEAGAFTGAVEQKPGRFELAEGGTIFLDEVGDLTPEIQVKLLRVLQERELVRVGGTTVIGCDVRVMAATNHDLAGDVKEGKFRDDLFYRLNVFPIELPPLRERKGDIGLLAEHFLERFAAEMKIPKPVISTSALEALQAYEFPGNIRELQNILERACLLCRGREAGSAPAEIFVEHMPREVMEKAGHGESGSDPGGGDSILEANERALILEALEENDWNQSSAARSLGISRDNIRYRIKKYGIEKAGGN